jgi:hypothetical protein
LSNPIAQMNNRAQLSILLSYLAKVFESIRLGEKR